MKLTVFFLLMFGFYGCRSHERTAYTVADVSHLPIITKPVNMVNDSNEYFTVKDSSVSRYSLPKNFIKPGKWAKRENQSKALGFEFYGNSFSDSTKLKEVLKIIDLEKDFPKVCSAKSWSLKNYHLIFPHLIVRLTDKRKVGLENTADLIIPGRSDELIFYGHGGIISEDLFTVAGRVSWILNEITGEKFAVVHPDMTKEEAEKFKVLWLEYINQISD